MHDHMKLSFYLLDIIRRFWLL